MAIGDNYNDVSMFQRVGRAVAMGNAPQEIKEFAHIVTGTNDEHGVAQAILNALETVKNNKIEKHAFRHAFSLLLFFVTTVCTVICWSDILI